MAMSPNIADRELKKFEEDADGNPAIRTIIKKAVDEDGDQQEYTAFNHALVDNSEWGSLFHECLKELKKINFQLAYITGQEL